MNLFTDSPFVNALVTALACHWSHWTWTHWAYDFGAFVILALPCLALNLRQTLLALFIASLAIPLAVALFLPTIGEYRGLSGLCSTLYVLLSMDLLRRGNKTISLAAGFGLALFTAKLLYEFATGAALFVTDMGPGVVPVPLAHLVGAAVGLIGGTLRARSHPSMPSLDLIETRRPNNRVRPKSSPCASACRAISRFSESISVSRP